MSTLGTLFAALVFAAATVPALAQNYPAKPVRIIVPFAPGGGSDFIGRFIAQRLTDSFGKQVIVENKPGAGGVLGIEQGVKSVPDGYTLVLIASSYTVNPAIYKLSFDPVGDITPIIQLSQGPLLVVVRPSLPAKNVLAPEETLAFRSRLAAPPPEGHEVVVRFFNRRDLGTGMQ